MNSFVEVIEIRHVKVYAHWSVLAIGGLFLVGALERPLELLVALFSYYGVILLHECGHMVAAQRKGRRVNWIRLYPILGLVCFEQPYSQYDRAVIAWAGIVAQSLVAIPIGLELIVRRDRASLKRLRILPGLGVFLAIAVPYFFLVYARVGLGPLRFFFLGENLQRFTGQIYESGSRPFWYELAAFFSDFAPWSLLLFPAAWFDWRRAERERTSRSVTRTLYLWLVYTVVLFSLASFKRDYYLLPAMPAAALIIGPLLANAESLPKFARRIVAGFLVILGVVLLAIALLTLRAAAVLLSVQSSLRFLPPVIALVGLLLVFTWVRQRKTWQASLILAATIWATMMSMQLILLPAFLRYQPTPQLAASIPAGRVVYTSRAADEWASGVAFNLPAPHAVERLIGDIDDQKLLDVLKTDPRVVAIIWEREYASLVKNDPALKILADIETYGHGGLSLNLIRNPVRQHVYLVGHDH